MLARLVQLSIRARAAVLVLFVMLLAVGGWAVATLPIDALPDVSTVQVSVLTKAAGLSPVEVERTVTIPIENGLNGIPNNVEIRSVSRAGLSAVTVIFEDDVNVWFARQLVLERLRGLAADLPVTAETPELAPVSTGLGEIYQFVVRSDQHSPMQLRTLLDWEIVPKLRGVPGVIEVNTQGGDLKEYQVVIDPGRLKAHRLTLENVVEALSSANLNVGGGYIERQSESYSIRGHGLLANEDEIGDVVVRTIEGGPAVLVRHLGQVKIGAALRYGMITYNGQGEAVTGTVLMLLGSNSRDVVRAVGKRVSEIRQQLPAGVDIDVVYDRADFVGRTISTVIHNLAEGVLIVTLVLTLFLGTIRGAVAVVLGIPASMSVALLGMHVFGVTGDLMSLGAIDFGFLVDGPIVMLEAVVAGAAGRRLSNEARAGEYARIAGRVARPVAFAVAIIMLVYIPLLGLQGVEGKMFRPMALTMASALFGALVYSVLFFPAILATLVPVPAKHGPRWVGAVSRRYQRMVGPIIAWRWPLLGAVTLTLLLAAWRFSRTGADFVPRIFEGDAVVTIRRAPSISLEEARTLDLQAEKVLHSFPEVASSLAMTGRAEVATDPVGNDNTDILIRLKPQEEWTSATTFDDLSTLFKDQIESRVPGTFVSVSQPIEDKTNELISGSRADVQINISGNDLDELARLANAVGKRVATDRRLGRRAHRTHHRGPHHHRPSRAVANGALRGEGCRRFRRHRGRAARGEGRHHLRRRATVRPARPHADRRTDSSRSGRALRGEQQWSDDSAPGGRGALRRRRCGGRAEREPQQNCPSRREPSRPRSGLVGVRSESRSERGRSIEHRIPGGLGWAVRELRARQAASDPRGSRGGLGDLRDAAVDVSERPLRRRGVHHRAVCVHRRPHRTDDA